MKCTGGTFTLLSLSCFGVEAFTPPEDLPVGVGDSWAFFCFFCLFVWFLLYSDVGTVGPVGTLKPDPVTMV
jgi:hypothetical protein